MRPNSKTDSAIGTNANILEALKNKFPCREAQIETLSQICDNDGSRTYPSIYIYGQAATGKTALVASLLEFLQVPTAFINCIECYSLRLFFETILCQLSKHIPAPANGYRCYVKCENANDFRRLLKNLIEDKCLQNESVYIVLDNAERLREMDLLLLPALLRLRELLDEQYDIRMLLISELPWDKFRCRTGLLEPIQIHFPNYTRQELLEIMCNDCPSAYDKQFYQSYISILLSVFGAVCHNLSELRHLAKLNFSHYCKPIELREATTQDVRKLWRNIEPHFRKALDTVYLREVSTKQWQQMQGNAQSDVVHSSYTPHAQKSTAPRANIELPFYSKYLLIAAYLASYNPAKSDKRFFSKRRLGKTKHLTKKGTTVTNQLIGPKAFAIDRMLAIFYSIVEDKVAPSARIFSQISSLVTLRLLARVGNDDQIDSTKYRCLVSLDFVSSVAKTLKFDVRKYLYDFL